MGLYNNLISGLCASMGGVLNKVGFSFGDDGPIKSTILPLMKTQLSLDEGAASLQALRVILHAVFIGAAITVGGLMYSYYVKSMQENGAAKATVYNFAVI